MKVLKSYAGGRIGFCGSFADPAALPVHPLPEIAFAGRSNVGKSSAINKLLNADVARTSKTPGRTQLINLFTVEGRWVLADLPGYGFAKVPDEVKKAWKGLVEGYLGGRPGLKKVVVLIDSRHPVQPMDAELIWGLRQAHIDFVVLATKCDKLGHNELQKQMALFRKELRVEPIPFSSQDGTGVEAAWKALDARSPA